MELQGQYLQFFKVQSDLTSSNHFCILSERTRPTKNNQRFLSLAHLEADGLSGSASEQMLRHSSQHFCCDATQRPPGAAGEHQGNHNAS